jgi:protein Hikeshi
MSTLPSAVAKSGPDSTRDPTVLAERIVKHLFNYVSGFVGGGVTPESAVPMSVIAKWYDSFMSKVRARGVGFLERGD